MKFELLMENWRKYVSSLQENFYLTSDKEKKNPLSFKILQAILSKVPNAPAANSLKPIEASGAEGIVFSLDDYRVIKMFFSLDNALKSAPLFSKSLSFTANIYSAGKVNLDSEVIYFREKSSYSGDKATPTKTIYYLVMERVVPDEDTYNSIEVAYDRYMRLSKVQYKDLMEYIALNQEGLTKRIKSILTNYLVEKGLSTGEQDPLEVIKALDSKKRNIVTLNEFSQWAKSKTKEFVLTDTSGKPLLLKNLLLNSVGFFKTVDFDPQVVQNFLLAKKEFSVNTKSGKSVKDNYLETLNLLNEIIIKGKIPWRDIHKGQFGRNKKGKLIALDLGVKQDSTVQQGLFNKNVSSVSLKGAQPKMIKEEKKKIINFWDFDKTLFDTDDKETGKRKWEKIYNKKFPHIGWFSKQESLDPKLDIRPIKPVIKMYDSLSSNSVNIILSDRLPVLENAISKILKLNNISVDEYLLNYGKHKTERIKDFLEKNPNFDEINIFDDKKSVLLSHLKFKELYSVWRPELIINIYDTSSGQPVKKE